MFQYPQEEWGRFINVEVFLVETENYMIVHREMLEVEGSVSTEEAVKLVLAWRDKFVNS